MYSMLRPAALVALLLIGSSAPAADKRPMKLEDLYALKRVASPQISPDGKHVVYQVSTVSLEENKSTTALWLAATDAKTPPKQLTKPDPGKKHTNPKWSPDGKHILFEFAGDLYVTDLTGNDGQGPNPMTNIVTGATNGIWSPDGKYIAFVSAVYPEDCDKPFLDRNALARKRMEAAEQNPVKAKVFTKLFYRHWDEYVEGKRQHIHVIEADLNPGRAGHPEPRDVTPGDRDAYPTSTTFSSGDDFTFTPDGKHLVFTAVPEKEESWSTNYDICRVSITNTSTKWECLTTANKAADSGPKFSPDGKKLAWRAQKTAGYEADKWEVVVADAKPDGTVSGKPTPLLAKLDVSANEFVWYDNDEVLFAADVRGETRLQRINRNGGMSLIPLDGANGSLSASIRHDPPLVAFTNARMQRPAEVFAGWPAHKPGSLEQLSHANDKLLAELDLPEPESVKVKVEGAEMQMWVLKPPGFDEKKKWPVVYLVHGGPQGAWEDGWSYRWNPQLWAAQGYVVVLPNPRGSTGFGQKFVDEITGDWGGKCYRDLVAGLQYVKKLPYVDADRMATAGASFGGYMQNWFAVNDIAKEFKCQINHCSVWNFESMWGTTDELWFDEWEHGGLPWEKPGRYAEFSPHKKAGELGKYKVPMLVIQNDLDFRCPVGQGHELFSALQRQGVPSKFINFPDEGHWVLKPKNSAFWHKEVFAWLTKYCPPGGK